MRGASIILAATSALLIPSISAQCSHTSPLDIAVLAACGNQDEIVSCLTEGEKCLQDCLVSSGCLTSDAQSFKLWYENGCEEVRSFDGDLRRRQLVPKSAAADTQEATTTAAAKTKAAAKTTAAATTKPVSTTAEPTTATETAQTSESTTAAVQTTSQVTTSAPKTTVTALAQTAALTTATSALVCFTTSMISVTWCMTTTQAGTTGTTCVPTSTPSVSCNEGLLCKTTDKGQDTCMRIENTPPLSGIIISAVLGVSFASMLGSVIFMACRSRAATSKARKQAEALAIVGASKSGVGSSAMASEAYLPLIHAQAPEGRRRDVSADYAGAKEYGSGSRSPSLQRLKTPSTSGGYQDAAGSEWAPSVPRRPVVGLADRSPLNFDDDDIGYGRQR